MAGVVDGMNPTPLPRKFAISTRTPKTRLFQRALTVPVEAEVGSQSRARHIAVLGQIGRLAFGPARLVGTQGLGFLARRITAGSIVGCGIADGCTAVDDLRRKPACIAGLGTSQHRVYKTPTCFLRALRPRPRCAGVGSSGLPCAGGPTYASDARRRPSRLPRTRSRGPAWQARGRRQRRRRHLTIAHVLPRPCGSVSELGSTPQFPSRSARVFPAVQVRCKEVLQRLSLNLLLVTTVAHWLALFSSTIWFCLKLRLACRLTVEGHVNAVVKRHLQSISDVGQRRRQSSRRRSSTSSPAPSGRSHTTRSIWQVECSSPSPSARWPSGRAIAS